ncbi:MAG TPA: MraY family glycosyltransferase [Tepidisphaeraceae bacterium]
MPTSQPFEVMKEAISADQALSPYVYVFYVAFIVAFLFTPVMRSVAIYYNIVDKPDLVRKLHTQPVAYLGGVAVFLGWLAGMAMTQFVTIHHLLPGVDDRVRVPLAIIVAAFVVMLLGLWDDTRHIAPRIKIAGQVLAAVLLLTSGIGATVTSAFVNNVIVRVDAYSGFTVPAGVSTIVSYTTSSLMALGLVIFCCNASNLMDGLDGLCGGVTAIIAAGFLFLAVIIAQQQGAFISLASLGEFVNREGVRIAVAIALLGAILGFVPYNFNPASIFMGDAGSMFLGFFCALMILLLGELNAKWLLAGMVMFALPVLDTGLAFARRYVAGRPFFSADRHHFHHQLVQRGLTVKQAVLISYALTLFFVLCGIGMVYVRTRYALAFYMVLFGSIIVAAYKMGMVHERDVVTTTTNLAGGGSTAGVDQHNLDGVLEVRKDQPVLDV